jgi:predicted  nucleic acid-binding Zn-ribbon protein
MKRIVGLMAVALLAAGCATNSSVKEQIDPLASRLTSVEQKQADLDAKLADLSKRQDAQGTEIAQAQAAAQKAAADAQDAANRAESAAEKSTKAFALGQKKGK